jgi:hypothetical protein
MALTDSEQRSTGERRSPFPPPKEEEETKKHEGRRKKERRKKKTKREKELLCARLLSLSVLSGGVRPLPSCAPFFFSLSHALTHSRGRRERGGGRRGGDGGEEGEERKYLIKVKDEMDDSRGASLSLAIFRAQAIDHQLGRGCQNSRVPASRVFGDFLD